MKRQSLLDSMNIKRAPSSISVSLDLTPGYDLAYIYVRQEGASDLIVNTGDTVEIPSKTFSIQASSLQYRLMWEATYLDGTSDTGTTQTASQDVTGIASIRFYGLEYIGPDVPDWSQFVTSGEGGLSIFDYLKVLSGDSWIDPETMTQDYLLGQSGTKAVSNIVMAYLAKDGDGDYPVKTLSQRSIEQLARIIWARFGDSWQRIHDALLEGYKPLDNYNMVEVETPDLTETKGVSDDFARKTRTEQARKTTTTNRGTDSDLTVYGFNSGSTGVPESKTHVQGETESTSLPASNYDSVTETQEGSETIKHTGTRRLTRSGNIGVTTSQQMLEAEIALRRSHHLDDVIYQDMDQILTIAGYAPVMGKEINII